MIIGTRCREAAEYHLHSHEVACNREQQVILHVASTYLASASPAPADRGKGEERCDTYKISAKQVKEGLK